jgi:methylmalonyl-CoA epimerase
MITKMHHTGIIVDDLERAIKKFEGFGLKREDIIERKGEGIKIVFFPIGDSRVELLTFSPDKGWDPVHTVVRSQKGAVSHICFEVDDLDSSIKDFEKSGAKLLEGCPMAGAHGRVAFFNPETTEGVLIELCQE